MPEVDPDDDSIWRWVLHHYRFDPDRRERRNVIVTAYDSEAEFNSAVMAHGDLIRAEIDAGERDRAEHLGGFIWHPGYRAEQVRRRAQLRAVRDGADPRELALEGPLPAGTMWFGWDSDGTTWSIGGAEPPDPRTV